MPAATDLALFKAQLNLDHADDDLLLGHKLHASETWIANHTGVPFDADNPVMVEAALHLSAYWYESREAVSEGRLHSAPFSVHQLLESIREAVTGHEQEAAE